MGELAKPISKLQGCSGWPEIWRKQDYKSLYGRTGIAYEA